MAEKATIRSYQPSDDQRITEITRQAWSDVTIWKKIEDQYGPRGGKPWWYFKITPLLNFARSNPQQFFVAQIDGKVVGYAMFVIDPETKVGTVLDNAVDPACQGRGVGSLLHKAVLLAMRDAGMEIAKVGTGAGECQAPARKLYEKHGFKEVFREVYYIRSLTDLDF